MQRFTRIEGFDRVYKRLKWQRDNADGPSIVNFNGSIKLHGSNCSIQRSADGKIRTFSRNRELCPQYDMYGFALMVSQLSQNQIDKLFSPFDSTHTVTIYGERIGAGIHGGVAINQLPSRQFVIFAAFDHEADTYVEVPNDLELPECNIFNCSRVDIPSVTIDIDRPAEADAIMTGITQEVESQ